MYDDSASLQTEQADSETKTRKRREKAEVVDQIFKR